MKSSKIKDTNGSVKVNSTNNSIIEVFGHSKPLRFRTSAEAFQLLSWAVL